MADDDLPIFPFGVCLVIKNASQRIAEPRLRFLETDAVLPEIDLGLSLVPFKAYS